MKSKGTNYHQLCLLFILSAVLWSGCKKAEGLQDSEILPECSGSVSSEVSCLPSENSPDDDPQPAPSPSPSPSGGGFKPSNGKGGSLGPGKTGSTSKGAQIYIPTSYAPTKTASSVIVLFNLKIPAFKSIADSSNVIIVNTVEYADESLIFSRYDEALSILTKSYNIDLARIYWAGWSHGGNISLLRGTDPVRQVAGIMVFPGAGGDVAYNHLKTAVQGNLRRIALTYYVGSLDTQYGYVQYIPGEVKKFSSLPGFSNRIQYRILQGVGHAAWDAPGVLSEAWKWISQFNTMTN